jgi:hypothetical protein
MDEQRAITRPTNCPTAAGAAATWLVPSSERDGCTARLLPTDGTYGLV